MKNIHNMLWRKLGLLMILATAGLFSAPLLAQTCSTGGPVTLTSQAQVDSFQVDYGPCDLMSNDLTLSGADITDVSPLGLTTFVRLTLDSADLVIDGNPLLVTLDGLSLTQLETLEIWNNPVLTSINGLSAVTNVTGAVLIQNNTMLSNVDGLSGLSSLPGGALLLWDNSSLSDLSGASGITSTGGSLVIMKNDALTNLDALGNMTAVNGLNVVNNDALVSISGLSNLTSTGATGSVDIRGNPNLASLVGLSGLTHVGGLIIYDNDALTDLNPLSGITHVGNSAVLALGGNDSLTDITGLGNVQGVGSSVDITGNTSLSQCSILARLLDQVDDFAPGPGPGPAGIPDVGGDVTISGNLAGCNSIADIVGGDPPLPPTTVGPSVTVPSLGTYAQLLLILMVLLAGLTWYRRRL